MKKRLIKFLLRLLGHNNDKTNVITIEVDAKDALITLKKIQDELEKINRSLKTLPKAKMSDLDLLLKNNNLI